MDEIRVQHWGSGLDEVPLVFPDSNPQVCGTDVMTQLSVCATPDIAAATKSIAKIKMFFLIFLSFIIKTQKIQMVAFCRKKNLYLPIVLPYCNHSVSYAEKS
jgi:hypothetical protein